MSKTTKIVPAGTGFTGALALPEYLKDMPIEGTEELSGFITPPRIKVVQKSSKPELLAQFAEGDIVLLPDATLFAEMKREDARQPASEWSGAPFRFTPVFFFAEYVLWNPLGSQGSLPMIRARSIDGKSQIAMKARNRDMWFEECPDFPSNGDSKRKMRYCEHLNFVIALHDGPYQGTGIVLSFSRGSHFAGSQLCNRIKMRKAPIYACVFEARSVYAINNQQQSWFRIQADNPPQDSGSAWVTQEQLEVFKALHEELKAAHDKLLVDYGEGDDEPGIVDVPTDPNAAQGKEY